MSLSQDMDTDLQLLLRWLRSWRRRLTNEAIAMAKPARENLKHTSMFQPLKKKSALYSLYQTLNGSCSNSRYWSVTE